tara:strand:+ start:90 stop:770 length:681 start_codon:yes stop_codon:yes gene_type:complete
MGSFWLEDPSVLVKKGKITDVWPREGMSSDEKLNAISRMVIGLTLLGFLLTKTFRIVVTGVVTLAAIVVLRKMQKWKEVKEKARKKVGKEGFTSPDLYQLTKEAYTKPTEKNPAMNVLLPERKYDPKRRPAAPAFNPKVTKEINAATQDFVLSNFGDKKLRDKLFNDLGDNFVFEQSMRPWHATPNTQIPNDQGAFAEYCYGDMISCKEGDALACERNSPPRWING